jgi:uncharacterized membrane protein YdcZ (DUF606 family)
MGTSQSSENNQRIGFGIGQLVVIFLLLVLGWVVIQSFSYLFTRFVLRKLKTFGGVLGVVIVISGLYLSISVASGTFLFLPTLGTVEDKQTGRFNTIA